MTQGQAKAIVLHIFRPRVVVCEVGDKRFFVGIQRGRSGLIKVSDTIYFTTESEARWMADHLEDEIRSGKLKL